MNKNGFCDFGPSERTGPKVFYLTHQNKKNLKKICVLMWMSKQKTKCWSLMWMSKAKENLRFNVDVKKKNKSAGV
jgi:hypothetical protein